MTERIRIEVNLDGRDNLTDDLRNVNRQLNTLSNQGGRNMQNFGRDTRAAGQNMRGMYDQVAGVAAAFAGMELVQRAGEMINLGEEAGTVQAVFEQLAGGTDAAQESLTRMREAVGGSVTDLELMRNANSLLLTGIAKTNEQASELVELGAELGQAMGIDAASSIENLNSALLNNSFVRLDTLGISAAAVRDRVAELKNEGLDMSEAFAQATLEQGRQALERLGDAATAGQTPIQRLSTIMKNAGTTIAVSFTNVINEALANAFALIGQLETIGELTVGQQGVLANDFGADAEAIAEAARTYNNALVDRDRDVILEEVAAFVRANGEQFSNFSGVLDGSAFASGSFMTPQAAEQLASQITGIDVANLSLQSQIELYEELDAKISAVNGVIAEQRSEQFRLQENVEATVDAQDRLNERLGRRRDMAAAVASGGFEDLQQAGALALFEQQQEAQRRQLRLTSDEFALFNETVTEFAELQRVFGGGEFDIAGGAFFDPAEVSNVRREADELVAQFEELQRIGEETDYEFISPEEVEFARQLADEAAGFAEQAERGAAAFEGLSLSGLLGQGAGGQLGELLDLVTANLPTDEETGAVDQSITDAFNLASGRDTVLSRTVEDQIAPALADVATQISADAATTASQAVLDAINAGRIAGQSDEAIGLRANVAAGASVLQTRFEGSPLAGLAGGLAGGFGAIGAGEEDGGLTADAEASDTIAQNLQTVAELDYTAVSTLSTSIGEAQTQADAVRSALETLSATEFRARVPLELTLDDQTGANLGSNPAFAAAVQFVFNAAGEAGRGPSGGGGVPV